MTIVADKILSSPPSDAISSLKFSPSNPHLLAASSWDSSLTLYNTDDNKMLNQLAFTAPLLDLVYHTDHTIYTAGLGHTLYKIDTNTSKVIEVGGHRRPISTISSSKNTTSNNSIITGSWDKSVKVWDERTDTPTHTLVQPERVYSLDTIDNILAIVNATSKIMIYDLRYLDRVLYARDSVLKYQLRQIKCRADSFTYCSVEGRIAVDYFDLSPEAQAKKFSFKCHRQKVDGVEIAYPVNTLAYNPNTPSQLASGGAEGVLNIWDTSLKKRVISYPGYPSSISAVDFNCAGGVVAVGSSYTFEEGEKDHPPDQIFIKILDFS